MVFMSHTKRTQKSDERKKIAIMFMVNVLMSCTFMY